MVPKSGARLPKSKILLSDAELAAIIGDALQLDLGGSRRASKTIMAWTGVSDHTARAWLNGRASPSGIHLLVLAANSKPVMTTVLRIKGHERVAVEIDLETLELGLMNTSEMPRELRSRGA